jgi:hypothetical protein
MEGDEAMSTRTSQAALKNVRTDTGVDFIDAGFMDRFRFLIWEG